MWPVRDSRYWCTRSSTSPQIFSGEVRNMSSVDWIVPCPEFSTGTTPKSAWPAATSSNTSSTLASGRPLRRMAEVLVHRLLRERAFRPEVTDLQRLLLRQACRHDFAEQAHQHFVGERAVVAVHHAGAAPAPRARAGSSPPPPRACPWPCRPAAPTARVRRSATGSRGRCRRSAARTAARSSGAASATAGAAALARLALGASRLAAS